MGAFSWILSWFRRSKPGVNYEEILTQLQTELREWEEKKAAAISSHRTAVTRLLLWACMLEVIFFIWYYFCTSPTDMTDHLTSIAPVLLTPLVGYLVKRIISWMYNSRICRADEKMIALENQQAEKVEELKRATNFYKTAQLVQQFDRRSRTPVPASRKQPPGQAARKVPATPGPPAAKRPSPPPHPATVGPSQRHARPPSVPPPSSSAPADRAEAPAPVESKELPAPAPVPGPRPVPPQRGVPPTTSRPPTVEPPPQTPSRSYYMPVPDRNNPVALPASSRGQKPRGWLDTILDVMVGDNESNSVPVRCARCNALYGHVPRSEVGSYQFTCRKCRHWNDPLNPTAHPPQQPQQQQPVGRSSNSTASEEEAEAEDEFEMPDLPTGDGAKENAEQRQEQQYEEEEQDSGELPEEDDHLLTDVDPITADNERSDEGDPTKTKSE